MKAEQSDHHQEHDPLKKWWNEMVSLIAATIVIFGLIAAAQYLIDALNLIRSWIN